LGICPGNEKRIRGKCFHSVLATYHPTAAYAAEMWIQSKRDISTFIEMEKEKLDKNKE
jgi:hypothetical protein